MASLGNEPAFAASFSSGIAMRVILGQDSVQSLKGVQYLSAQGHQFLQNLGVVIDASEESVAYSGGGVGDCGGGPFRMLFGDGEVAVWAARAVKALLMILPALASLQWLQRAMRSYLLLGCVGESLMMTYDCRGTVRQILFLMLFVFI